MADFNKIAIFWDYFSCPLPHYMRAQEVSRKMKSALQSMGKYGPVEINAYVNTLMIPFAIQSKLDNFGVNIKHASGDKHEASDKKIIVDMIAWARDNPSPSYIMIISDDYDFIHAIRHLLEMAHTILVSYPYSLSKDIVELVEWHCKWSDLLTGKVEKFKGPSVKSLIVPAKTPCPATTIDRKSTECRSTPAENHIPVYWDYQNCSIPKAFKAVAVKKKIELALQSVGKTGDVQIRLYGDRFMIPLTTQTILLNNGVAIEHSSGEKKEVADKHILADMLLWTAKNPPPASIMIITGDGDFTYALSRLMLSSYDILVAYPNSVSNDILDVADWSWTWLDLLHGEIDKVNAPSAKASTTVSSTSTSTKTQSATTKSSILVSAKADPLAKKSLGDLGLRWLPKTVLIGKDIIGAMQGLHAQGLQCTDDTIEHFIRKAGIVFNQQDLRKALENAVCCGLIIKTLEGETEVYYIEKN